MTGADSGIGKAVAIAFGREGADVAISYLNEHDDAADTAKWVKDAGQQAVLIAADLSDPQQCREVVSKAVDELGGLDVLVSNAAFQMTHETIEEISDQEWDYTLATNISALFHLTKAALPHLKPGSSVIATSSVNSDSPTPTLLPYDVTKAAMANFAGPRRRSFWGSAASGSTALRPGQSGPPSSLRPCRQQRSIVSAATRPSGARASRLRLPPYLYCWPLMRAVIYQVPE